MPRHRIVCTRASGQRGPVRRPPQWPVASGQWPVGVIEHMEQTNTFLHPHSIPILYRHPLLCNLVSWTSPPPRKLSKSRASVAAAAASAAVGCALIPPPRLKPKRSALARPSRPPLASKPATLTTSAKATALRALEPERSDLSARVGTLSLDVSTEDKGREDEPAPVKLSDVRKLGGCPPRTM